MLNLEFSQMKLRADIKQCLLLAECVQEETPDEEFSRWSHLIHHLYETLNCFEKEQLMCNLEGDINKR